MAFIVRVLLIVPGFGTPQQNDSVFLKAGNAIASGSNTVTLTGWTVPIAHGWIRLKWSASSGAGTVTSYLITMTDGTTTENDWSETLVGTNNSYQSPSQVMRTIPFLSDLLVTSVSVITVVGTAGGTLDVDLGVSN
jgi:hypothetical protein